MGRRHIPRSGDDGLKQYLYVSGIGLGKNSFLKKIYSSFLPSGGILEAIKSNHLGTAFGYQVTKRGKRIK